MNASQTSNRTPGTHGDMPGIGGYRPEIDGLRAVAVTSVVLYHVGVPGIAAGFVGVDVFFVISGYLITAQLWASREKPIGALLLDFYARRARRILPSLAIVVATVLILGKVFLLPSGEQQDLAKSALATVVFLSNVFFWRQSNDYFAPQAELQPLLHTWSLAVEEQFYLIWPLLLAVLWRWTRKLSARRADALIGGIVLLISLFSLALSIRWTAKDPVAAFFMMPSRFWELGSGAMLAMYFAKRKEAARSQSLGFVGLLCIFASIVLYTRYTPWPGVAVLVPVLGSVCVIAARGRWNNTVAYRLLSSGPMVLTGAISYSWYLWHWPLITLGRILNMGSHNFARDAAFAALSYLLAYLSTRFVETPIRKKKVLLFSTVRTSLLTGCVLMAVTAGLSLTLGISARTKFESDLASLSCLQHRGTTQPVNDGSCALATGQRATVYLVGDSHANHWAPAIATWANAVDARAIEHSFGGCPVPLAWQLTDSEIGAAKYPAACQEFSQNVMTEIAESAAVGPTLAVVSAQWEAYTSEGKASREILFNSLNRTLSRLEEIGVRTLIVGPTPQFDYPIPSCLERRGEATCRITRAQHEARSGVADQMLKAIAGKYPHARLWEASSVYCDASYCYPSANGAPMFWDEHHLTRQGTQAANGKLQPELNWLLASPEGTLSAAKSPTKSGSSP